MPGKKEKSTIATGTVYGQKLYLKKTFCQDHGIEDGDRVTVQLLEVLPPKKKVTRNERRDKSDSL